MTIKLSWLEDFLALAESGNFSRAAEQRHMTQPAFSRRIRALEEWLDVPLFDRGSHPVTLTETGQWLRTSAREVLTRVARLPDEARAVADASSATLRFAATHALSLTFLPTWLRSLEALTAIGPIQLVSDVAANCEALMVQGRVQFLLCHFHPLVPGRLDAADFRSVPVGSDTLLPVCAPAKNGKPRYALVRGPDKLPLLAYSPESGLGRVVRTLRSEALEKSRAEPVVTAHLATLLKAMALEGRGVAWLPMSLIGDELREHRLVEAGARSWRIPIEIRLFRRQANELPAAEAFWRAAGGK
ncbi:MAG: LysR family transcriptional regulator [Betaproteobacteria bacterium]